MPITNASFRNNFLEIIERVDGLETSISILIASGIGTPNLEYSATAIIPLAGKTSVIPITGDKRTQEIWLTNQSDKIMTISIGFNQGTEISFPLAPGESFTKTIDGKTFIMVDGDGDLFALVRSDKGIPFALGVEEMPVPVKVGLLVGTGGNYENPLSEFYDSDDSTFNENLVSFLESDEGITGYKLAAIDQFQPGLELNFNVSFSGANYDLSSPVSFQWISLSKLVQLLATVASDLINPESSTLSSALSGLLTRDGWAANVEENTTIKLQPTMTKYIGRFAAKSLQTGYYDTCIITGYTRNEGDPYQGGTFTLTGF
ncbi:MAG: hypothetical protein ACRC8A_12625 [Microcoleaceae cyanobacterium]